MFNNFFKHRDVYDIMWKNMAQPDRPQVTTEHGWITKAMNTHSAYVILIVFPRATFIL
jgi:BarA-like signal transduction histidine kinase